MKIILDAFGGDNAPLAVLQGAEMAVKELDVKLLLTGDEEKITLLRKENNISFKNIEVHHTNSIISMEDSPTVVLKSKKDSSMTVALHLLKEGKGEAVVSAGNTGALTLGANLIIGTLDGIKRAAIATIMPTNKNPVMILDSGANLDCSPERLVQFAAMGSAYMKSVMGIKNPSVGLANIGVERHKGTRLQLDAYALLENTALNFIGNAEVRDIPHGFCDVVVADGFTGNIILKMYEGVASALMENIKAVFKQNIITMLSALMVKNGLKGLKKKLDASEYGGAPLLGLNLPVIKAHGSSDAKAIKNAVRQAYEFAQKNVISDISTQIKL